MITLGVNLFHSDTSACIFVNGKLIAAAEEERFIRVKHTSAFPFNSLEFCLKEANINFDEIDKITINSNPFSSFLRKIFFVLKNPLSLKLVSSSIKNSQNKLNIKNYFLSLSKKKKLNCKIEYIDHHESHIASSYYFSKFDESVNVSIDGFGDFASCAWGYSKNNKIIVDNRVYFPHSLGIFYQALTQFLGFKNYGDEYKVMGLSSYGEPQYVNEISKLIYNKKTGFELNLDYFIHQNQNILINKNNQFIYKDLYSKKIYDLLGEERKEDEKISQKHKDLAKSIQTVYENIFFELLENIYSKYKIKNLTLSGGCAMNSVANGKILKNTSFENMYISPNPGDAGGSVGSAVFSISNSKTKINPNINYAYLGSKFTSLEIEKIILKKLNKKKFKIKKYTQEEILKNTVDLLMKSKIVGWFQGRMEWGPRALGNRSILADARNPNIKEIINIKIKRRESFRPFAPSILIDHVDEWFQNNRAVPFMSEVYPLNENKKTLLPGITHIDGTGRLQTVSEENNPVYYYLLKKFKEKTGVPILLNTSFNENEPIVQNPNEAIDCFIRTNMDALVIEDWIISR